MIYSQEHRMLDALNQFLDETRDTREYKRALAVKMAHKGLAYDVIAAIRHVSQPFISKGKRIYADAGIEGLRMGYHGGTRYLTSDQRDQTIAWLRDQESWSVPALHAYLQDPFQVVYQSLQSSYDLLHAAGLSRKKTQVTHPQKTTR